MNARKIADDANARISSARACNGKWTILQGPAGFNHLFTAAGEWVRVLPAAIHHSSQAVWSWTDLDVLYYVFGGTAAKWPALRTHNVISGLDADVRIFHAYTELSASHSESDLTKSGFLALCGVKDGKEYAFAYNVLTGNWVAFPQSEPFDGIKVTEGGRLILSCSSGIYALTEKSKTFLDVNDRLVSANGHACTINWQDRDYLLFFNSNENPIVCPDYPNGVVMVDVLTGEQRGLISFPQKNAKGDGWAYSLHISPGPDGSCIVSVYAPDLSLPFQIYQVYFSGLYADPIVLLYEWHSAAYRGYDSQPRASYGGGNIVSNIDDGVLHSVWQLDILQHSKPILSDEGSDEPTVEWEEVQLTADNQILWIARDDNAFDVFDFNRESPSRIDYPDDKAEYRLKPFKNGLKLYKKKT